MGKPFFIALFGLVIIITENRFEIFGSDTDSDILINDSASCEILISSSRDFYSGS